MIKIKHGDWFWIRIWGRPNEYAKNSAADATHITQVNIGYSKIVHRVHIFDPMKINKDIKKKFLKDCVL